MSEEKKSSSKVKEKLTSVKGEIEHLEVQLALGKKEAVAQFEEQKQQLKERVEEAKVMVAQLAEKGEEKAQPLRQKLEELQVQLALGKADSLKAYKEQEEKLSKAIYDFKQQANKSLDEVQETGEAKVKEALTLLNKKTTDFKSRMEMFRVQLALGEAEAKEEWHSFSKDFMLAAKQLGGKVDRQLDEAEDKAEEIGEELSARFYDLKKSFIDLFK